jgi:DNA-binding CsgD family transcriptional regulator
MVSYPRDALFFQLLRKFGASDHVPFLVKHQAAVIFTETLVEFRAAATATAVRRAAKQGLRRLHLVPELNGSPLPMMLRESCDYRIRALHSSRPVPDNGVLHNFLATKSNGLTRRECEVLGWIAQGKRDAEIGAILGIAKKTIGKHIEHLLSKLNVETRTAAVSAAYHHARHVSGSHRPSATVPRKTARSGSR